MVNVKCPACGSSKVEQIGDNKYQCPYCGTAFSLPNIQSEYVINIHGYTQLFAVNPAILIKVDGKPVDKVGKNGVVQIKIDKPCQLKFECSFRSTTINIDPSTVNDVYLSFDRFSGSLIASTNASAVAEKSYNDTIEEIALEESCHEDNILDYISWFFYGIAVIDFCGMFFGYDLTGYSNSPILFAGIGSLFTYLAKKL